MSAQIKKLQLFLITVMAFGCSPNQSHESGDASTQSTPQVAKQRARDRDPQSKPPDTASAIEQAEARQDAASTEIPAGRQIFHQDLAQILQSATPVSSGDALRSEVDLITNHLTKVLPQTPDVLELRARFLNLVGDLDGAETTWRKAIQIDTEYGYAYHGLGKIAKLQGNFERAIEYFRKSQETQPDNVELTQDLANALISKGNSGDAVKTLETFMERNQKSADILLLHGNACMAEQKFEDAKSSFSRVLQLYPNAPRARDGLISALVRLGQRDEARKLVQEKRRNDNTNDTPNSSNTDDTSQSLNDELKDCSQIYFQACIILANMGYPDDAELLAKRATIFDPHNLKSWRLLIGFGQASSNEQMLKICQAMTVANPGDPSVYFEYGSLLLAAGESQAAKSAFKKVMQLSPQDPAGYAGVIQASIQAQTELPQALETAKKLVQIAPSVQHYDLLAQTYALMGDFENAWQAIEIAIGKDPHNQQLRFAKEQLEKIRTTSP